jgi:MFS family permease
MPTNEARALNGRAAEDPDPWPSPLAAWWAVAVFGIAAILSYTDRQILSLLVDPIRADLGVSDTQMSLLQGVAFALIYSVAGLPLGRLADLVPRRALLMTGIAVWTAGAVACGFAGDFAGLFVARVCVGIGEAALTPTVISMMGDLIPPHRRGTAIGVFWLGMVVGGGAALWIGGSLLQAAQSGAFSQLAILRDVVPWRASLLALALPGLAMLVLLLTVKEPARRRRDAQGAGGALPLVMVLAEIQRRGRLLYPLLGAGAVTSAVDFSLLNWAPSLLSRSYGYAPQTIGELLGAVVIATAAGGAVVGGLLSDRLGRLGGLRTRMMGCFASAACGLPILLFPFTHHAWQAVTLLGWWNFFSTSTGTMGSTVLQEVVPARMRGVAVSLGAFCNIALGLGLGTTATALLADFVFHDPRSLAASVGAVAIPAALGASIMLWIAARAWRDGLLAPPGS